MMWILRAVLIFAALLLASRVFEPGALIVGTLIGAIVYAITTTHPKEKT